MIFGIKNLKWNFFQYYIFFNIYTSMTKDLLKRTIDVLEQMRLTELVQIDDGVKLLIDLKKEYELYNYNFANISCEQQSLLHI
jgi:hypothetical protein